MKVFVGKRAILCQIVLNRNRAVKVKMILNRLVFISKSCNLPSNVNDVRCTILEEKSSSDSVMQSFETIYSYWFCIVFLAI